MSQGPGEDNRNASTAEATGETPSPADTGGAVRAAGIFLLVFSTPDDGWDTSEPACVGGGENRPAITAEATAS